MVLIALSNRKSIIAIITLFSTLFIYCVLRIPVLGFWSDDHTVKVYSNGYWILDVIEYKDHVVNTMHTEAGKYNMTLISLCMR